MPDKILQEECKFCETEFYPNPVNTPYNLGDLICPTCQVEFIDHIISEVTRLISDEDSDGLLLEYMPNSALTTIIYNKAMIKREELDAQAILDDKMKSLRQEMVDAKEAVDKANKQQLKKAENS